MLLYSTEVMTRMKSNYLNELKKQYLSANGLTFFGTKEGENECFIEWFKERSVSKELYKNYLLLNDIDYNYRKSAEIGKGNFDSIASEFGDSVLLTKYAETFDDRFSERLIRGVLYVGNKVPCAVIEDVKTRSHSRLLLDKINLFYTQNIYFADQLEKFVKIHNNGKSVLVGAYGKIYDKDRIAKIKQLKNLKEQLLDSKYKENYIYSGDNYSYFLYTDPDRYGKKYINPKYYTLTKER